MVNVIMLTYYANYNTVLHSYGIKIYFSESQYATINMSFHIVHVPREL